jgi:hypothetical protein
MIGGNITDKLHLISPGQLLAVSGMIGLDGSRNYMVANRSRSVKVCVWMTVSRP